MNVAWIGLGKMGLRTAKKVAAAGHPVRAYDVKPLALEDTQGLLLAGSAQEAVEQCDLLCIALYSDDQVEALLAGPEGLLTHLRDGAVVAIFTTGTIVSAQLLASGAPPGVTVLDTCFSHAFAYIESGLETLLVGGDAAALERCRPVFSAFSRGIYHVGGCGAGRAIKLVNNILFYGNLQLATDALRLAEGLGLEREATARILLECSGKSDVLNILALPRWVDSVKAMHPYMVKDVTAAVVAARAAGVDLGPLGVAVAAHTASQVAEVLPVK